MIVSRNYVKKERSALPDWKAIAQYFGVTVDYLLGMTEITASADEICGDPDIISIQRAKSKMIKGDPQRMMQMLRIGFDYAFKDENNE